MVPQGQQSGSVLYAADPHHLWNRIHRQLHVRLTAGGAEYGDDEVDPLLWSETTFLLTGQSHAAAIALLDEFLATHGERLISDPVKRAVFQHDLWAVFDWTVARTDTFSDARLALATRLARVIRRVALTSGQIATLPDNYAAAVHSATWPSRGDPQQPARTFLPPDLFDTDGPWTHLNDSFIEPIAAQHAATFSHSEFIVLLTVPDGVQATLSYLQTLWDFAEPYLPDQFRDGQQDARLNPMLPQFPSGTQAALVRKMLLIDDEGHIQHSSLVESIQLRVFHAAATRGFLPDGRGSYGDQDFFEFRTLRRSLFAATAGGFHALGPDQKTFVVFSAQGFDNFDAWSGDRSVHGNQATLKECVACHSELNVQSLRIVRRLLKPYARLDYRHPRWSAYAQPAIPAKERRSDWGLLKGLWASAPR